MEDLKHKFLGFINKQGHNSRIPSMGFSDGHIYQTSSEPQILSVNSKTAAQENRPADQDILDSIEKVYFENELFDPNKYVIDKLPDCLECSKIEEDFNQLKLQHQVVSKKVLQLILEKQSACNEEFAQVLDVQSQLENAVSICQDGRGNLALAKKQFTTASLGILANYRKRQLVQGLLHSLNAIKLLQRKETQLQDLFAEGNYPAAITLLIECQQQAENFNHFNCVAALVAKMKDTLVMGEEHLDVALAKICFMFDTQTYTKLQDGYRLLGKTQIAMDQLHMHFTSAIHSTAFSVVHGFADRPETPLQGQKKQYKQLCQCVSKDDFIPCLVELCRSLWNIMASYHEVIAWHSNRMDTADDTNTDYIKQKLDNGLSRIWHDVQSKISAFLISADLGFYKFEQFLQVLGIVHRLIEIGDEFCGSKSEELQDLIKKHSVNYFKNYHASRLEELRIFLENEGWEICPVKPNFNILQLQEFKPLRSVLQNFRSISTPTSPPQPLPFSQPMNSTDCSSSNHSHDGSSVVGNFFVRYNTKRTPFDARLDETLVEEDFYAMEEASGYFSEDSDDTELKENKINQSKRRGPLISNTTLTVLRHCGRYLQMSRLLRSIALDIIICMSQLFEYYFYAVHIFFAADLPVGGNSLYSQQLGNTLRRITETLIHDPNLPVVDNDNKTDREQISSPCISSIVDLSQTETLHGLSERVVAVESLLFLAKQFKFLQPYLEHLVPSSHLHILQQFYNQSVCIAQDLRRPVYMCVAARAFDLRQTLISISKVNWEVSDVMIQHSSYIDVLLREVQIFSMRLEDISNRIPIPVEVYETLWENIAHIVTHTLVEGYSNANKCSTGGRALMQLDFTQFLSKFEKMVTLRPIPHREYVELYVKAYYLPESLLDDFIKEHTEYSAKHMVGLVTCTCQNNKKARQRLFAVIEDLEKERNGQSVTVAVR